MPDKPDDLTGKLGDFLKSTTHRPWYELPKLLAMPKLIEIRNQLRRENLHDTEEPPFPKQDVPSDLDPAVREGRTVDGSYNDLNYPAMGCAHCTPISMEMALSRDPRFREPLFVGKSSAIESSKHFPCPSPFP